MTAYDDVIAACTSTNRAVSEAWGAYQDSIRKVKHHRKLHQWAIGEVIKHVVTSRVEIINARNTLRRSYDRRSPEKTAKL